MATTPEGSPYVESSDLVATYPTTSLALANRVDLVGVLPFATSAARATAIPSPTDGQYTYLQDTNKTQFWNGTAWTNASTGLVQLAFGNFSAASVQTIDSVFVSSPSVYMLIINSEGTVGATAYMSFNMRTAGVVLNSAASYTYSGIINSAAAGPSRDFATTTFGVLGNVGTVIGQSVVWIVVPASANYPTLFSQMFGVGSTATYAGTYNTRVTVAGSYDGIQFQPASGTMSGTYRLYQLQGN